MPMPATLEGQIARYADRIAYLNHDIDDAVRAGLLTEGDLPEMRGRVRGGARSGAPDARHVPAHVGGGLAVRLAELGLDPPDVGVDLGDLLHADLQLLLAARDHLPDALVGVQCVTRLVDDPITASARLLWMFDQRRPVDTVVDYLRVRVIGTRPLDAGAGTQEHPSRARGS